MNDVNREVAEKVMKFEDCGNGKADWYNPETGDYYGGPFDCFDPMHRIEHSMLALEKFPEYTLIKFDDKTYQANIIDKRGHSFWSDFYSNAPEAICRAALAAKEE